MIRRTHVPILLLLASSGLARAQNALDAGQPNRTSVPQPGSPIVRQQYDVRGRALDANLQRGSGGFNAPGANFYQELALRNAVVTGNVGGGKAFRGDVGYTATDDFRGSAGSDDLFSFQRDSSYSGLATQGLRGITPLQFQLTESTAGQTNGILGDLIIRRSSTASASGDVANNTPTSALTVDPFGNLRGSLRSTSDFLLRNARFPRVLGSVGNASDGASQLFMAVNPLLGVKALTLSNPAFSKQERPELMVPGLFRATDAVRQTREDDAPDSAASNPLAAPIDPRPPYEILREDLKTRSENYLSTRYGENLKKPGDAAPEAEAPPIESIEQRLDRELDAFREQFRKRLETVAPPEADPPQGDALTPERPADAKPKTPEEIERQRNAFIPVEELAARAENIFMDGAIRLDSFLARHGADDLYSWHMARGQEALRKGDWFDAEERFTAALRAQTGDAMAATARIHAQIGAGMFLSAGLNMRNLFAAYPEMIPARFASDLFPQRERLEQIRALLRDRMRLNTSFARESALLLAYIGWQTESADEVSEGFSRLRALHDESKEEIPALERVLEAAWTK